VRNTQRRADRCRPPNTASGEHPSRNRPEIQVVLVGADSLAIVRKTHSPYFSVPDGVIADGLKRDNRDIAAGSLAGHVRDALGRLAGNRTRVAPRTADRRQIPLFVLFGVQPESRTSSDIFGRLRTSGTLCVECVSVAGVESDVVRSRASSLIGPRQLGLRGVRPERDGRFCLRAMRSRRFLSDLTIAASDSSRARNDHRTRT
jgi:hypothetical protein